MVLDRDVEELSRRRKIAEENNPLLKLSLGELVMKMQLIAINYPEILLNQNHDIEYNLIDNKFFKEYMGIVKELERREIEYTSYKAEPRIF